MGSCFDVDRDELRPLLCRHSQLLRCDRIPRFDWSLWYGKVFYCSQDSRKRSSMVSLWVSRLTWSGVYRFFFFRAYIDGNNSFRLPHSCAILGEWPRVHEELFSQLVSSTRESSSPSFWYKRHFILDSMFEVYIFFHMSENDLKCTYRDR